jgi:hypothetical protein
LKGEEKGEFSHARDGTAERALISLPFVVYLSSGKSFELSASRVKTRGDDEFHLHFSGGLRPRFVAFSLLVPGENL